jgi:hypothetical protein
MLVATSEVGEGWGGSRDSQGEPVPTSTQYSDAKKIGFYLPLATYPGVNP